MTSPTAPARTVTALTAPCVPQVGTGRVVGTELAVTATIAATATAFAVDHGTASVMLDALRRRALEVEAEHRRGARDGVRADWLAQLESTAARLRTVIDAYELASGPAVTYDVD
jgi:hypothetical protein